MLSVLLSTIKTTHTAADTELIMTDKSHESKVIIIHNMSQNAHETDYR